MSKLAIKPRAIPAGVEVVKADGFLKVKGKKGSFEYKIHPAIDFVIEVDKVSVVAQKHPQSASMVGTAAVMLDNMLNGVSASFEKKLKLNGVGYRAKVQGNNLELTLGYSHPITYVAPAGITIQVPNNTEIVISGTDKQIVGQTAADIRSFRAPECYKGKGVRYENEQVSIKQAKKKK